MQCFLTTCRVQVAIYMTSYLPVQCFLTICTAGGQEIITVLAIYMTSLVLPASAVFLDNLHCTVQVVKKQGTAQAI